MTENRLHTITQKLHQAETGLKASCFVHVDFNHGWEFDSMRFSEKGKDWSEMDAAFTAFGDIGTLLMNMPRNHEGKRPSISVTIKYDKNGDFESIEFDGLGRVAKVLGRAATEIIQSHPEPL